MSMWLCDMPHKARIFLKELKNLALLEFIPYNWLTGTSPEKQTSPIESEMGIDRFGDNSLVNGAGSMLVIALGILIIIAILIVLKFLSAKLQFLKKLYLKILNSMRYSGLLRYVL